MFMLNIIFVRHVFRVTNNIWMFLEVSFKKMLLLSSNHKTLPFHLQAGHLTTLQNLAGTHIAHTEGNS